MSVDAPPPPDGPAHMAARVMHFGRVLRHAGMAVPTDRIQLALQALPLAGLGSRQDFHDTLAACLLDRADHRECFEQAFQRYWGGPGLAGLPAPLKPPPAPPAAQARASPEADALRHWSARERLHQADFDTMTEEEWRAAKDLLRQTGALFAPVATRRNVRAPGPGRGARIDARATLQAMARQGGELLALRWRRRAETPAPLVVLADISGSMSRYSRMLLHFAHAVGQAGQRVESFVFGTRLTRTTYALRQRDPDLAVARVAREAQDWAGGTRITQCLRDFNRDWARRVAGQRCTLLLISDGLESGTADDPRCEALRFEMERLQKSCRRLVWLNPLLRFDKFQPRAAGIRAMLPHVDQFLPAHNLDSLQALADVLGGGGAPGHPLRPALWPASARL